MHTCTHGWVDVDFLKCQSAFASAVCGRMQSHISARKSLRVFLTSIPHSGPRTHSPLLPHLTPHQQIPRLQWLVCRSRASHARGTRIRQGMSRARKHALERAGDARIPSRLTHTCPKPSRCTSPNDIALTASYPQRRGTCPTTLSFRASSLVRIQVPGKTIGCVSRNYGARRGGPEARRSGRRRAGVRPTAYQAHAASHALAADCMESPHCSRDGKRGAQYTRLVLLDLATRGAGGGWEAPSCASSGACVRAVGLGLLALSGRACQWSCVCATAGFYARGRPSSRLSPQPC